MLLIVVLDASDTYLEGVYRLPDVSTDSGKILGDDHCSVMYQVLCSSEMFSVNKMEY